MRYLTKATVVALGGLSLVFSATVNAQESKDHRVWLDPEITDLVKVAETPPKELPVIYA